MNALVVYASQFGSTHEIALRVGEVLRRAGLDVTVADAATAPDPTPFEAIVVGSAVHGGRWLEDATAYLRRHRETLAAREVWLFSSGPVGDRPVHSPQPDPKEVVELRPAIGPRDHRVFAGAFDRETADFSGLGLVERTVVRRFLPEGDWRDWPAIEAWAEGIAHEVKREQRELAGIAGR